MRLPGRPVLLILVFLYASYGATPDVSDLHLASLLRGEVYASRAETAGCLGISLDLTILQVARSL